MYNEIEEKNQKELLRVYESDLKKAKSDKEKDKLNQYIAKAKAEISKLEAKAN